MLSAAEMRWVRGEGRFSRNYQKILRFRVRRKMSRAAASLRLLVNSSPEFAREFTAGLGGIRIDFLVVHGSTVDGGVSATSDVDFLMAVPRKDVSSAQAIFHGIPAFDVDAIPVEHLLRSCRYEPLFTLAVKYGLTLIDTHSFKDQILRQRVDARALKRSLELGFSALDIVRAFLDHAEKNDELWACAYSLMLRFRQAYAVKCLVANQRPTRAALQAEAARRGVRPALFSQLHAFYQRARDDQMRGAVPTKDRLLPLFRATEAYLAEARRMIAG